MTTKEYKQEIEAKFGVGSKVLAGLTIKTIGTTYVTCISSYNVVSTVTYTMEEFYYNFCTE